jgi:sulfur-carrier protein adenylyltransferase/sulfurtransferase
MFSLRREPLAPEALREPLKSPQAGGYATFEGWVRDHNEGKRVLRLDYEAYESMAVKEGTRIVEDAIGRFGLVAAQCVHRVGELAIGDLAVWVGVSSAHRGEAFKACRYIIDEVKHRLPIWKKEHYTDGDSGWVNCEACAHPHTHLAFSEQDFYDRQIRVPQFGVEGQQKLRDSRVLVVGAGGLGCPVLQYLAAAGVGTLGICDGDALEVSNLHRQPLFRHQDLGKPKAHLAAEFVRALNPFVQVDVYPHRLTPLNAELLFDQFDLVLDCTDNFETKFLINDTAVLTKTPTIVASIYQFEGQLSRYTPGSQSPCMRCLWPEIPEPGCVGSCAEVGVLGIVPGLLGIMQATEALKHLLALPEVLQDELLIMDCLSYRVQRVRVPRAAACPVCGENPVITAVDADEYGGDDDVDVDAAQLAREPDRLVVLDMREPSEILAAPIARFHAKPAPAETIFRHPEQFVDGHKYVLCCDHGIRSRSLALHLRRLGYRNIYSLRGGTEGLKSTR